MNIFEGTEHRMTKMNITFSVRNGLPNTVSKLFPLKKSVPAK